MRFAYLILAHKNPFQLRDLVDTLQDEDSYFFIHIDEKTDIDSFLKEDYSKPDHIFFCDKRKKVSWGGFSQIEATINLIRMLTDKDIKPDYVHLLSGQDFPLKSKAVIKEFFKRHKGENFINYFPMPYKDWAGNGGMDRLSYKWLIDEVGYERAQFLVETQKQRQMVRTYPPGFKPYGGSQWWSFTGKCIEFIAITCAPGNVLYDFYKYTFIPDEMFFQTLLLNSPFYNTLNNSNLRYIDWQKGPEYPRILRTDDLSFLLQSENLFARKFDDFVDSKIRNRLKSNLNLEDNC